MSNNDVGEEGHRYGVFRQNVDPGADGLVLVLESNPDVAGAGRTSLEAGLVASASTSNFRGRK